jgi:hypothetical protein
MMTVRRFASRMALVALAVIWSAAACAGAADPPEAAPRPSSSLAPAPSPMPVRAPARSAPAPDGALIERLFRETGAERELPGPNWTEYVGSLAAALLDALFSPLGRLRIDDSVWARAMAWSLLGVIVICVAVILSRWIRRARGAGPRSEAPLVLAEEPPATVRALSRDQWRAEMRARLAQGDVEGALEALWWWFARSLVEQAIDPSWTSGELLAHAGRADLGPRAAVLDRMLYGPVRPHPRDVLALGARLEADLT